MRVLAHKLWLLKILCDVINLLSVSTYEIDSKHYSRLYGKRLVNEEEDEPLLYRRNTGTGFPLYEAQLQSYERDSRVHAEARNEQIKQYKEYNTRYTETSHENVNSVTASTDKSIKLPAKSDTRYISTNFMKFPLNPQVEEENVSMVSRSNIRPNVNPNKRSMRRTNFQGMISFNPYFSM